jgi:hypothetical protein
MEEDTLVQFIFYTCILEMKHVLKATTYMTGLKLSLHPWTEPFDTSVKHLAYELLIQTSLKLENLKRLRRL